MSGKETITMNQKEAKRIGIIHQAMDKQMKQRKAAELLQISDRQVRRIVKRVRKEGERGVVHTSRGRPSHNKMKAAIQNKALQLYRDRYKGFGPTLASEKLLELDKIKVSDETLRNWLMVEGEWIPKRKYRKHRQWRERKQHFGEMVQIDGSHHDWFEGRGPKCVLMGYIDDATNRVYARFYPYEGTLPGLDSFKRYTRKYGLPNSIYIDRHTTYKSPAKPTIEEQLNAREPLSQFGRAMKELEVDMIYANTPQAKGRVERMFQTFQDRLVKEMRLEAISSISQANRFLDKYLPGHNRRFGIQPVAKANLHRPDPGISILDAVLCKKTEHPVRNDCTVTHEKRLYQLKGPIHARKVVVEERLDAPLRIMNTEARVCFKEIDHRLVKPETVLSRPLKPKCYPSPEHPWKKYRAIAPSKSYTYSKRQQKSLLPWI